MRGVRSTGAWAAVVMVIALLAACRELLGNPFFDRWCGEMLCDWEVEEGRIERVPTWHERDYAAALVETPTRITQLSEQGKADCVYFELVLDSEASAQLLLELDFNDDGTVDVERALPAVHWKRLAFKIYAPAYYEKLRFALHKRGQGRAVVAQLRAREIDGCTGPRTVLRDQRPGAACSQNVECSFGLCTEARCSSCREDADCSDGKLCVSGACSACREDTECGAGERCIWTEGTTRGAGRSCVEEGARLERGLRELCDRDADCLGTRCAVDDGAAMTCGVLCGEDVSCPDGLVCKSLLDTSGPTWVTHHLCAEPSPPGGLCFEDGDCASGRCCKGACAERDEASCF